MASEQDKKTNKVDTTEENKQQPQVESVKAEPSSDDVITASDKPEPKPSKTEPTMADLEKELSALNTSKTTAKVDDKKPQPEVTAVIKPKNKTAVLAFILSLSAVIAIGVGIWQGQIWLANQQQVQALKQQAFEQSQQTVTQLQSQIAQLQNNRQQQINGYNRLSQNQQSMGRRIKELAQHQPNHWLAAEGSYLINLAERKLVIEQDITTAIQLLVDANARFTAMNDASVMFIRTAISEDIAKLHAIKQPESDAIYLALSGLIGQLEQLKFAHVYIPEPMAEAESEQVSDDINDWKTNLSTSAKRFFGNFIKVTERSSAVTPQLPVEQQWYVLANISNQLVMAQHASLKNNQTVYQESLKLIDLWLEQYFDTADVNVVAFANTLTALAAKPVNVVLPTNLSAQALAENFVIQQAGGANVNK